MSSSHKDKSLGPGFWELARQALSSTSRGYDLLAPKFEHTDYATPPYLIECCLDWAKSHFPLTETQGRGADLACGTGRASRLLARHCNRVDAVDFSAGMLEVAAHRNPNLGINWVRQDLRELRLEPSAYQRIVSFGAWGHVLPDFREHVLRQILDGLAPEGVFITLTPNEPRLLSRRFWANLAFDTAIRLRNLLWFHHFHMYYGINNTGDLLSCLNTMIGEEYILVTARPDPLPHEVSLLAIRRRPSC